MTFPSDQMALLYSRDAQQIDAKLDEKGSGSLIKPFHLIALAIHFSPLSFGLFDCFD